MGTARRGQRTVGVPSRWVSVRQHEALPRPHAGLANGRAVTLVHGSTRAVQRAPPGGGGTGNGGGGSGKGGVGVRESAASASASREGAQPPAAGSAAAVAAQPDGGARQPAAVPPSAVEETNDDQLVAPPPTQCHIHRCARPPPPPPPVPPFKGPTTGSRARHPSTRCLTHRTPHSPNHLLLPPVSRSYPRARVPRPCCLPSVPVRPSTSRRKHPWIPTPTM